MQYLISTHLSSISPAPIHGCQCQKHHDMMDSSVISKTTFNTKFWQWNLSYPRWFLLHITIASLLYHFPLRRHRHPRPSQFHPILSESSPTSNPPISLDAVQTKCPPSSTTPSPKVYTTANSIFRNFFQSLELAAGTRPSKFTRTARSIVRRRRI
jgi:hypothetical protein